MTTSPLPVEKFEVQPRPGLLYVCDETLSLAVRVAGATKRPLLLLGEPGVGKSTMARWLAANARWRYYEHVVTSRSRARDLLYSWDAIRRLADAQAGQRGRASQSEHQYVVPGALWWAIDPQTAASRGGPKGRYSASPPGHDYSAPAAATRRTPARRRSGAVVLIDEIDKAESDYPNDLLSPLDALEFDIDELPGAGVPVRFPEAPGESQDLLIIITSNGERDLPAPFVRRCVVHWLEHPKDKAQLLKIAEAHFTKGSIDPTLSERVADFHLGLRRRIEEKSPVGSRKPGVAEFLDTIRACADLGVQPPVHGEKGDRTWEMLQEMTLAKSAVELRE